MRNVDYSIYFVTDRASLNPKYTVESSVEAAILGGASVIQLREKNISTKDFFEEATRVKKICNRYQVPLIINDRLDIALAVDADGIHIGQDDLPIEIVRGLMGDDKLIGLSVSNKDEAILAEKKGCDYIGVGAMYQTGTKTDAHTTTKEQLKNITDNVDIPVVVIGGINERTIPDFKGYDIDGVAIVSAITTKDDIVSGTKNLRELFYKNFPLKHCIFDLDGTIFDSIHIWGDILKEFLKKGGLAPSEEYLKKIWELSFVEAAKLTKDEFDLSQSCEEILSEWDEMAIYKYKNQVSLNKGAKEILLKCRENGIKTYVATALKREIYEQTLKHHGIDGLFDGTFSTYDAKKDKTDGSMFQWMFPQITTNPKNILVIEDDPFAAIGAKKNLARTALVPSPVFTVTDDIVRYVDIVVNGLDDNNLLEYIEKHSQ